jgi:hypothetical protein
LESGRFVYASAQLSNGHPRITARALELAGGNGFVADHAILVDGRVHWSWQSADLATISVVGSDAFWEMRLPLGGGDRPIGYLNLYRPFDAEPLLFDVNYLTNVFQPAVIDAAERIFQTAEQSMPRQKSATAR